MKIIEREGEYSPHLSQEAQEVLGIALEEAATFSRGYVIDTADLLIGLLQIGSTAKKLKELGVTRERIREVKNQLGGYDYFNRLQPSTPPRAVQEWSQLPRTVRMRKIGSIVTKKAVLSGKETVEPKDILKVIVEEGEGMAARVLRQMGIERHLLFGNQNGNP